MDSIEYITPTSEDQFNSKEIFPGVFVVKHNESRLKVKLFQDPKQSENGQGFDVLEFPREWDERLKKLLGYVITVLLPEFKKRENEQEKADKV